MSYKSNLSYKLRTKQMVLPFKIIKRVESASNEVGSGLFTIEDLRARKCIMENTGSLEELTTILNLAFPDDHTNVLGTSKYYCAFDGEWTSCHRNAFDLPIQSSTDFFNQIKK